MTITNALVALPPEFPGMDAVLTDAVYLMGCGKFDQYCCTLRSVLSPHQFCPFCEKELRRRMRIPMHEHGKWMVLANEFPRDTKKMLLIVPKRHLCATHSLTRDDWESIGVLFEKCGIENGGVMFRFGDPKLNAGTIQHLHINVIEPITGVEFRAPFAKDVAKHVADYERLIGFQHELLRRGGLNWLFSERGVLETQPKVLA